MRKPLSPLQAFAEDARHASERASDVGDALIPWLSVAQSANQLSSVTGTSRSSALDAAQTLLEQFASSRPSMRHDARPAPTDQLGVVAERFRVAAEEMERAGCFELAYTTVSAICRLTARADYVSAALATVHLGRIARQMNDGVDSLQCCSVDAAGTRIPGYIAGTRVRSYDSGNAMPAGSQERRERSTDEPRGAGDRDMEPGLAAEPGMRREVVPGHRLAIGKHSSESLPHEAAANRSDGTHRQGVHHPVGHLRLGLGGRLKKMGVHPVGEGTADLLVHELPARDVVAVLCHPALPNRPQQRDI